MLLREGLPGFAALKLHKVTKEIEAVADTLATEALDAVVGTLATGAIDHLIAEFRGVQIWPPTQVELDAEKHLHCDGCGEWTATLMEVGAARSVCIGCFNRLRGKEVA